MKLVISSGYLIETRSFSLETEVFSGRLNLISLSPTLSLKVEKKRIRIYDSGFKIEEYDIQENTIFKGYKNIVKTVKIDTSLHNALYNAAENIYKHLTEGQNLKCNIEDGFETLRTSIKIKESINDE